MKTNIIHAYVQNIMSIMNELKKSVMILYPVILNIQNWIIR
jgi:hypothetical protein